ncbi:divergent PAP2 family protein [Candidatus Saccharibacteria bacterium]|nr:divergent PAP2 family protein [Candidatus Saccharibacteria bacterium]
MNITPYLYVPLITWVIAQTVKFCLALLRGDVNVRYLYASGGMPSVHSAVVSSLVTYALLQGGPNSPLFGVVAVFAAIVIYDSFGVRRSAGDNARAFNKLIDELAETGGVRDKTAYGHLREILGHKPLEVLVGVVLGVIMGIVFGVQNLQLRSAFFYAGVTSDQAKVLAGLGLVVIICAVLFRAFYKPKSKGVRTALNYVFYWNMIAGLAIALVGIAGYEQVAYFSSQMVATLVVAIWLVGFVIFLVRLIVVDRAHKKTVSQTQGRDTWLKKAGKKKK